MAKLYFALCLIVSSTIAFSQYNLDYSFGNNGKVVANLPTYDEGRSGVLQPDGKIIVAGNISPLNSSQDFAMMRFNADGTPDINFGTNGVVKTSIGISSDLGHTVMILPDGKIILGGESSIGGGSAFAIARYNSDGSLDNSFGNGGIAKTPSNMPLGLARSFAIQPDGKIVIAGQSTHSSDSKFVLARFNQDGTPDILFGADGMKFFSIIENLMCVAAAVKPLDDGKLLVGGYTRNTSGNNDMVMVRLNQDGTPDGTFGTDGIIIKNLGTHAAITNLEVKANGKILAAGNSIPYRIFIALFNPDGTLDESFGTQGVTTSNFATGSLSSIAIQPDEKIIVAGTSFSGSIDFLLQRYHPNGTLDESFDYDGHLLVDFGFTDVCGDVVVSDSKIFAVGYSNSGGNADFAIAALEMNPTFWYLDADNDGYYTGTGIPQPTSPGDGYRSTGLIAGNDCIDNDATIYPGAPEVCDGKDNNCNGSTDEGCNVAPVLGQIGDKTVAVGGKLTFNVTATDGDIPVQVLQYWISFLPTGANFNTTTGEFSWTPTAQQAGSYTITFSASDGYLSDEETITITVNKPTPRLAPTITDFTPSSGSVGTVVTLTGTEFIDVIGVAFDGISATQFTVINATTIQVTVPNGATSGRISVFNSNGTGRSRGIFKLESVKTSPFVAIGNQHVMEETIEKLVVHVRPNPSTVAFELVLRSNSNQSATLRVVDAAGRVLESRNHISANSTQRVGDTYRPGVYFAEVMQGTERVRVKLIKQPN
ncbi:MAG TPA: MopE-related protein [Flavisolibacter sp.]|jgi:uncharacterized delta-60 repeat protein|nr:MopE-related protein [Flavisolibacter sp.]